MLLLLPAAAFAGLGQITQRYDESHRPEPVDPVRQAWSRAEHSVSFETFETWVRLSLEACAPRDRPRSIGIAVGLQTVADPALHSDINTLTDMAFMASLYDSRGIDQVVRLREPTKQAFEDQLTATLRDARCGDRVYLSYAGSGLLLEGSHGPTSALLATDSRSDCLVRSQCDDPRTLTSDDLAAFVTFARNRGVTPVLFVDSCHGTDVGARSAERVWTHRVAADADPLRLREGAAEFAAFFAADPQSFAMEIQGPQGRGGAFTFGLAQALRSVELPTPRNVADQVVAFLEAATPTQRPLIQATDPDMELFWPVEGATTRGREQLGTRAAITLSAEGLHDEPGDRWLSVAPGASVALSGRIRPGRDVRHLRIGADVVPVDRSGRFDALVRAPDQDGGQLLVTAVFEDFSLHTEAIDVVRPGTGTSELVQGEQYAVLFGVQDYAAEGLDDLSTPLGDVAEIGKVLTTEYGFRTSLVDSAGNEHALVLRNPSQRQILQVLELLVLSVRPKDRVLIYYAGHSAIPEGLDEAYWLPADADPRSTIDWVSADRVRAALKRMQAASVLVVSDSCYSAKLTRALDPLDTAAGPPDDRTAGLSRLTQARSRLLISSGANEPVLDGGGSGHSVFARALLTGLREQRQDAFTTAELFVALRERVVGQSEQEPQRLVVQGSGHDAGDFVFVRAR